MSFNRLYNVFVKKAILCIINTRGIKKMQKISNLFIQNIQNMPIWVKQVIAKEVTNDISKKLTDFTELMQSDCLFQYLQPRITFKGKQELQEKNMKLTEGYYVFLKDLLNEATIFDITVKNNWTLSDSAKIFLRLGELEFLSVPDWNTNKNIAIASFLAGKIKTGEFLKKIGKIDAAQLEQAIRYQKQLNEEGRHIKMASILIKMGFITDQGLDSLLILKDESKKRLSTGVGLTSMKMDNADGNDQVQRMQREIARLENENIIMKKRLKKLLNING